MKIAGETFDSAHKDVLVLPRGQKQIVFWAQAVEDYEEFEAAVPEPKPPQVMVPGGKKEDSDDHTYKQQLSDRRQLRLAWLAIRSLEPSNIEWDTVDVESPETWKHWERDLRQVLSDAELGRVMKLVLSVNALDEAKIEAAREAFLAGLAQ